MSNPPEVFYRKDGTADVAFRLNRLRPRRGKSFRSIVYHDAVVGGKDMKVYVKIWRKVPRSKVNKVMLQYAKDRMVNNSPVIL